jgi:hypothetical protein
LKNKNILLLKKCFFRTKNQDRRWSDDKPSIFGMAVPDFVQQPLKEIPIDCKTPYDFHRLFLDDEFMEMLVRMSRQYAVRKNKPELSNKITLDSLKISMAIMYMTGYISPSNRQMYWQQREDTQNLMVKKAMSRNLFADLVGITYFTDKTVPDPADRFWKVRSLFDQLNRTAKKYVQQPERVSVDEGIIKYFGPHPLKQYMKGKPHRFGYKVST